MLELRIRADKSGKQDGDGRWPIAGVELVNDAPKEHNFADSFVSRALADGYLEFEDQETSNSDGYDRNPVISGSHIVLKLVSGDLRYKVLEAPGRYSDEDEESGYRVSHEYRARLVK